LHSRHVFEEVYGTGKAKIVRVLNERTLILGEAAKINIVYRMVLRHNKGLIYEIAEQTLYLRTQLCNDGYEDALFFATHGAIECDELAGANVPGGRG
jgi:hypothetical protein